MTLRFANSGFLYLLFLLPLVFIAFVYLEKYHKARMVKVFSAKVYNMLSSSLSSVKRKWKFALKMLAVSCFVLALARPQSGQSQQKVKSEGIELMILFDVSRSMLAEDVKPNRLKFAQKEVNRFLSKLGGHKVGLIAFAGSGLLLSPMTTDTPALRMYIDSLSPDAVSSQGTEFKSALESAAQAFKRGGIEKDAETSVTKAIIIVSDGEDNEPGALAAAKKLTKEGIKVFSLGFGTQKGGAIPIRGNNGSVRGYLKDKQNKVILTKTQGTVLKKLATMGGGSFYHVSYGQPVMDKLYDDLQQLEKSEFENADVTKYDEKFMYFLILGLLFAFVDMLLGERKSKPIKWRGRFEASH